MELGILDTATCTDVATVKKAENKINQRLSRGRRLFFELIKEEIIATLLSEDENLIEEEMQMLRSYIGDISLNITS